ncbi:hypothetical protein TRM7615_04967 [Falsiruegeria mediterranea M17]|uniref:Uncharacterized protein n=1 Tax=Falsiruegeria mediterranea M17 TaxID=1200281 RepID=A0A2R8CG51_9RHOB|nr:hypothetical protein TRM7615_04967 [Falsiruegeria mediterranea M17]
MTREEMFSLGILRAGQEVQLVGMPASRATIVDARKVKYRGETMTFTAWAKSLTGWKGVNIFDKVELSTGERLGALRKKHLK